MLSRTRPRFRPEQAESIARERFRLDARVLSELPSERDQNFHLRDASGSELVLKIASSSESHAVLDFQTRALEHVRTRDPGLPVPGERKDVRGETVSAIDGGSFFCRLFDYLPGAPLARMRPHSDALLYQVGNAMGRLDAALADFTHEAANRPLKWRIENAPAALEDALGLVEHEPRREILRHFLGLYQERIEGGLGALPRGVIHNDPNDHNLLVDERDEVRGILDFGDMVEGPLVSDLANACAYAMLGKRDPLRAARAVTSGYHRARPLAAEEIELLFALICLRLALSVAISARQSRDEPELDYLRVTENEAWELLQRLRQGCERLAHYGFRSACGLPAHPREEAVRAHLDALGPRSVFGRDLSREPIHVFDLSVGSTELSGLDLLEDVESFTRHLFDRMRLQGARVGVGRYDEARPLYTSKAFRSPDGEPRTVHLGIDLFVEAGTEVRAPLEGRIHGFAFNDAPLDYGPTIVLEHETPSGDRFFTLYGHLTLGSLEGIERGKRVGSGEVLARVGSYPQNGSWPPHLHFQIVLDLLDQEGDFPGVASPSERAIWLGLSPDPSRLLGLAASARAPREDAAEVLRARRERLSGTLSLAYRKPLHIVRGYQSRLYDSEGRSYLDMVNNVCHVGHCHPKVVRALSRQAAVLNTNTRYLHRNIVEYAERLASLLPPLLEVVFFVNSGSEANDLALRLARTHTGTRETFVLGGSYHGNLTSLIEVSPYKFEGPGGEGAPPHVHPLDVPDGYRGLHRRSEPGYARRYVEEARRAIASRPPGALLAEAVLSCAGQIVLPEGYLAGVYRAVREAGGVAIADEVQVGFGRVGSRFWAFQCEDAVPDIVTLGKPIGNGHPLGAVVTTREIASSFQTGMEYFNTFGGNPVSCAVGLAVLDVIEEEGLQENALAMGELLLTGLRELKQRHPLLGDVRGRGLFLGLELVKDPESREPAPEEARALVNRMKEEGVLLSTEGPFANVVKIKPPLVFSRADGELFLEKLASVLEEERFRS